MEKDLNEICLQLDQLSLQILELSEEQVKCRVKLEEAMKPGFIHLAKSRYIMGNRTVCSLQLPTEDSTEFDALVTVQSEEKLSQGKNKIFHLVEPQKHENNKVLSEFNLRKRKEKNDDKESSTSITNLENNKATVDPIKWFGVLVPQDLRMAQNCFQCTLPIVVECANIQTKLQALQAQYEKILKEKQGLC